MLLVLLVSQAFALQNWKTYTNTTHMYDVVLDGNNLYCSTWGGLVTYNLTDASITSVKTIGNGLSDSNIRAIKKDGDVLYLGTERQGVLIQDAGTMRIPLNTTVGLPSNMVNDIALSDNFIAVATPAGVSVFNSDDAFPFPLLIKNYDIDNGLSSNNASKVILADDDYLYILLPEAVYYIATAQLTDPAAWHRITAGEVGVASLQDAAWHNDVLYLATTGGIYQAAALHQQPVVTHLTQSEPVYPLAVDASGDVWFSYGSWMEETLAFQNPGDYALARYTADGVLTQWSEDDPLQTKMVKHIDFAGDDVLIATWSDGAYILQGGQTRHFKPNCIIANLVGDMAFDQNNTLWISNGFLPAPGVSTTPKGTKGISSYDGQAWTNYRAEDTPLVSNNIYALHVDANNNKIFGSWGAGISIFNDATDTWQTLTTSTPGINMITNVGSAFTTSNQGDLLFANYATKVIALDQNYDYLSEFQLYQPNPNNDYTDVLQMHTTPEQTVIGCRYNGIRIWDHPSLPEQNGTHWVVPPFSDLRNAEIYDIASRTTTYGEELWIAASTGLYMYGYNRIFQEKKWHLYGVDIKKQVYVNGWYYEEGNPEYLYVVGQERLFGSVPTYPTALQVDPFGRVWIGTASNGFTIFTPEKDTYENYNSAKAPLLSDFITSFAYDNITGELYIGTPNGLNAVTIGITEEQNNETKLYDVVAYPNPFTPDEDGEIRFENRGAISMPAGKSQCKIYDAAGDLIVVLEKDIYQQFSWNGTNAAGKKCSSGLYFWVIGSPEGDVAGGKIALIR
jgi:ligand-binding sensor domain-containing protein